MQTSVCAISPNHDDVWGTKQRLMTTIYAILQKNLMLVFFVITAFFWYLQSLVKRNWN